MCFLLPLILVVIIFRYPGRGGAVSITWRFAAITLSKRTASPAEPEIRDRGILR